MLRQLEERQHFVENTHMYSLQDLIDVEMGVLVPYLKRVHQSFSEHIKTSCLVRLWLLSHLHSYFVISYLAILFGWDFSEVWLCIWLFIPSL